MKVIFMGTPRFAEASLRAIASSRHEVAAVVTQPDRVNARGNRVVFGPVKAYALEKGIPVYQFDNVSRDGESALRALNADVAVTAAYGQILRENILELCPHGVLNVHASLLPAYRGSSPVQWAIINGEKSVGVTIMRTERGIDTGDMLLKAAIEPDGTENSEELLDKLAEVGARLITEALDLIESGEAVYEKQDDARATHCRMLRKEDGKMDFSLPAGRLADFVRGINPWPGAFALSERGVLKVTRARVSDCGKTGRAGEIVCSDPKRGLIVACGDGCLEILRLKAEGGKEMDAKAFLLGKKLTEGSVLGE